MYYSTTYASPVGLLTLACKGDCLVGLWIAGQKYFGDTIPEKLTKKDDAPVFEQTKECLDRYFTSRKPEISELPLAPIGGDFRQGVWEILCGILHLEPHQGV
jgi:methylated-DNA-[protein]-cysteine S-methyltransferase